MEHGISSAQWYCLNELTAAIYNEPFDGLFGTVLRAVKELVPYSHSLTYLLRSEDGLNVSFNFKSNEIPPEHLRLYTDKYSRLDFINWYTSPVRQRCSVNLTSFQTACVKNPFS